MKKFVFIFFAMIGLATYWIIRDHEEKEPQGQNSQLPKEVQKPIAKPSTPGGMKPPAEDPQKFVGPPSRGNHAPKNDPRLKRLANGKVMLNDTVGMAEKLYEKGSTTENDFGIIDEIFRQYRKIYKENPVGENRDWTAAILGKNEKGVILISPDHVAVNEQQELVDSWGQAYFFHAISGTKFELWSAGPDAKWSTKDDLKFGVSEIANYQNAGRIQ